MLSFILALWVILIGLTSLLFGKGVALTVVIIGVVITALKIFNSKMSSEE